jgi:hypothetical protein
VWEEADAWYDKTLKDGKEGDTPIGEAKGDTKVIIL